MKPGKYALIDDQKNKKRRMWGFSWYMISIEKKNELHKSRFVGLSAITMWVTKSDIKIVLSLKFTSLEYGSSFHKKGIVRIWDEKLQCGPTFGQVHGSWPMWGITTARVRSNEDILPTELWVFILACTILSHGFSICLQVHSQDIVIDKSPKTRKIEKVGIIDILIIENQSVVH